MLQIPGGFCNIINQLRGKAHFYAKFYATNSISVSQTILTKVAKKEKYAEISGKIRKNYSGVAKSSYPIQNRCTYRLP